jgi:beta-glucosidase/6-phospho-beta-glucosidase/beta-galactosidase
MSIEFWTGIESIRMPGRGMRNSNLRGSHYWHQYRDDLHFLKHEMGIRTIRHPVPWDEMQKQAGAIDFTWMDGAMECCREEGITPVVDFVHHTAFSARLLPKGFLNPNFPERHTQFVLAFAGRYPWVEHFTLLNEPLVTAHLCGEVGEWYPYACSEESFARMVVNMAKAICATTQVLVDKCPAVRFVHIDSCESYQALEPESARALAVVDFANQKRFLVDDLIQGKIDRDHCLYEYLKRQGVMDGDLRWFQEHPARIDLRGLNYYRQSEWLVMEENGAIRREWSYRPKGLAAVAKEYVQHSPELKFGITETNFFGAVQDQVTWLKFTLQQAEALEAGQIPVQTFTWYPALDSIGFQHMMRTNRKSVDPVGLIKLESSRRRERIVTELTELYAGLARGELTAQDLPNYGFDPAHGPQMQAFAGLML